MHRRHLPIAAAAALLAGLPSGAAAQETGYPLFASETPLELKITGPFRQLARDDGDQRPERDSVLELTGAGGTPLELNVEIRVRGKHRLEHCRFPPLRVDFAREQVAGTVFEGQDHLKLVTHCMSSNPYRDYLTEEFLIYRLFNALTDRSFHARWAEIEYVYTDSSRLESLRAPAFLLEEDWEAAERLGLEVVEAPELDLDSLDAPHTALLSVFQYLIGNTDWNVTTHAPGEDQCCHNGKVLGAADGRLFVLPYDFDQAGLINTRYSAPSDILPIRRVTQRLYRGYCVHNNELGAAIAHLNSNRERMERIIGGESPANGIRRRVSHFLRQSFQRLNDESRVERDLLDRCLGQ